MTNKIVTTGPFDFPEPTDVEKTEELSLWATHYYTYQARAATVGEPLWDKAGNPLGPVVSKFDWCKAAIEGAIIVEDDTGNKTTYTYAAKPAAVQVDCSKITPGSPEGRIRYQLARGEFGDGVDTDGDGQRMVLVPFRTIAVGYHKPIIIPYKTVIYIPKARGQTVNLPTGGTAIHDGYFFAGDTGSKLISNQIDVFGGNSSKNPFPNFIKSVKTATFQAFKISNPVIAARLLSEHDD